ncbi:hypothetical protein ACFLYH_01710 [Candidatus Dependentiae bacterium]
MNYFKKILFSIFIVLSVSNYVFSMELSNPEMRKLEKVSDSFANNVFNRLKVDLSEAFIGDDELLKYLKSSKRP